MLDNRECLEIQKLPSGGFVVSDMSMVRTNGPGYAAHQMLACTSIDEALDFIRAAMTTEAKVTLTDAEIERLREVHKPSEITLVDDTPLWRR